MVPSGEMRGWFTGTLSALTRQARPPSRGASHTSSSAVKATNSPCRCGNRRYPDGCTDGADGWDGVVDADDADDAD
ncbi:hypothetical protein GCM10010524_02070 [Streptomyces mexicanus]